MSVPQVLEVIIGLILVYYILGSIISLITQWINEFFETRGKALERYLTKIVGDKKLDELIRKHFTLTPRGIIEMLDLRRPIYRDTAAYGHFGRTEPAFTWEKTDKADALKKDAGI